MIRKKMGFSQYLVNISFRGITAEREEQFIDFISRTKKIMIIFKAAEMIEYYLFVVTDSHYELERLMKGIRNEFFSEVYKIGHSLITNEFDLNYFPKGLLKGI